MKFRTLELVNEITEAKKILGELQRPIYKP